METQTTISKADIISALRTWIHQRPGLEFGNYGDLASYRTAMRSIIQDLHDARYLLQAVERSDISVDDLRAAFHAYSGRLTLLPDGSLDYCTGQYWPTEYRKAVAAVCASALWDYHRITFEFEPIKPGESRRDAIHRKFRRMFGERITRRYFN